MKVRCLKYFDAMGLPSDESRWLRIGQTYHVMGQELADGKVLNYLIVTNDTDPGFFSMGHFPAESFEIVSEIIPPNWASLQSGGVTSVLPKSWLEPGFFNDFYEGDPRAYAIYELERTVILKSDP